MRMPCSHKLTTVLVMSVLAISGIVTTAGAAEPVVLRWAHFAQENLVEALKTGDKYFAEEVNKRSGGRLKIQIYWGGTLGKENETLGLVRDGTVDIASFYTGIYESAFPLWSAPNSLFFVMTTLDEANQVAMRFPKEIPGVRDEIKKQNIKLLFSNLLPSYVILARKPLTKFEDLKGLKLRTFGIHLPRAYQAAGAVGVQVLLSEIYETLQRGVVDGTCWAPNTAYLMKLHTVAPHINRWDIGSIVAYANFMNLNKWNSLPPDLQKVVEETTEDTCKFVYENAVRVEAATWEKFKAEGAFVHNIPASERQRWINACPNFLDEWVGAMDKIGKGDAARQMKKLWLEIVERY